MTTGTIEWKDRQETAYGEADGGTKLAHAEMAFAYSGVIDGQGTQQQLLAYHTDGSGTVTALERVVGTIGGKSGTFVLRHTGTFDAVGTAIAFRVLEGCGTGELTGLTGHGSFFAKHGEQPFNYTFDYELT